MEWSEKLFAQVDLLLLPTTPSLVPKISQLSSEQSEATEYLADTLNVLANLIGAPALTLPLPLAKGSLPRSIQLVAAPGQDELLLERGRQFMEMLCRMP